jgi:hypothetical protein
MLNLRIAHTARTVVVPAIVLFFAVGRANATPCIEWAETNVQTTSQQTCMAFARNAMQRVNMKILAPAGGKVVTGTWERCGRLLKVPFVRTYYSKFRLSDSV